jgi:hypothetical protein
MRHDIPGGWVDFPDPDSVTNGQRKKLMRRLRTSEESLDRSDILVMEFIEGWSLSLPLPTSEINTLDTLPTKVVDAIYMAAGEILKAITPDFSPNPSKTSPTVPSSA